MRLNDRPYENWHEGLTIRNVVLKEDDDLKIHHLLGGG